MAAHPLLPDPECLTLDCLAVCDGTVVFAVRTRRPTVCCPLCGGLSDRIHSHYRRTLLDLPWQGNPVRIEITVRRFFCDNRACVRRIFTEPIPKVAARYARKTARLAESKGARELLGETFVDHYVKTRDWECRQFESAVTTCSCPARSANVAGRHLRARTW